MRKAFILLLMLIPALSFADTFVVTSNADSGPGTLREALQKASDNGSTVRDSIIFNLPAALKDRTITLYSTLVLSSNLVVDGSSEPALAFGVSGARINITCPEPGAGVGFSINSITDIAIYGLWINNFKAVSLSYISGAISMSKSKNVVFGKPNGGNVLSNDFYGIAFDGGFVLNDTIPSENIILRSNFVGLDTLGNQTSGYLGGPIGLSVVRNVTLGGDNPIEGNYIGTSVGIGSPYYQPAFNNGSIKISNNKVGVNYSKTDYNVGGNILIYGNDTKNSDFSIKVNNNIFGYDSLGFVLLINNISNNITINDNVFGQRKTNSSFSNIYSAIILQLCTKKDSISIFNNAISGFPNGIETQNILGITIRDNKIFCNQKGIAHFSNVQGIPIISIKQLTANYVSGKTIPNGKVQIFSTDSCQEYCQNGETLVANVIADNTGSFNFTGPLTGLISATVTDSFGTTSEFNGVKVDTINAFVKNAICGKNNGSITGIRILNASTWYWEDSAGNKISTDTNLINVAPGKYRLFLSESNVGCTVLTGFYTVLAVPKPAADSLFNITNPTCGQATGAITFTGTQPFDTYAFWLDGSGNKIQSYSQNIGQLAAGSYFFKLSIWYDSTCFSQFGPIVLTNQMGPSLKTDSLQITSATCGNSNGSISGIKYSGATGNIYISWIDTLGQLVGNKISLTEVPAGKYKLILKDGSACDSASTMFFNITNIGNINIDTSKIVVTPSSCKGSDASITGITSTNATIFKWVNTFTADTVGNTEDIINIPAGNYQLFIRNAYACTANTQVIKVSEDKLGLDTSQMHVTPSSCRGADGGIQGITSSNATIFNWVNTATGKTVGNAVNIIGISAGSYQLTCSNANGCTIGTDTITVSQTGFLPDTVLNVTIWDVSCDGNNGYIAIHQFTRDSALYSFSWVDSATNSQIATHVSIYGLAPGFYTLFATDTSGCKQQIFAARIKQLGKPLFDYSRLKIVSDTCNQDIGDILFYSNNQNGYTWRGYSISGQEQSADPLGLINLTAGQYYATITDKYNCTSISDTFTVGNYETVPPAPQAADQFILRNTSATLQVTNLARGTYNLYDTVNATMPLYTSSGGTFTTPPVLYDKQFYIQYLEGDCTSPLTPVWVKVYDSTIISAPNAFSPNGDGINDTWRLRVQGVVNEYTLTIFNRYGQVLYTSTDISKGWDGTMNGKPVPVGTYYYIIQSKDNNRPVKQTGYVVVLR